MPCDVGVSVGRRCTTVFAVAAAVLLISACGGAPVDGAAIETAKAPLVRGGFGNSPRRNFVGVFRTSTAEWFIKMLRPGWIDDSAPPDLTFTFGAPNDSPLVGDWDGNGTETPGVWRGGLWTLTNALGGSTATTFVYGGPGDVPVAGDWDGDGTTTPGYYRAGTFYLRNSNTAGGPDLIVSFAVQPGVVYLPLAGDWDGDGIDTLGLYQTNEVRFLLSNDLSTSPAPIHINLQFGDPGDRIAMGDGDQPPCDRFPRSHPTRGHLAPASCGLAGRDHLHRPQSVARARDSKNDRHGLRSVASVRRRRRGPHGRAGGPTVVYRFVWPVRSPHLSALTIVAFRRYSAFAMSTACVRT